MAGFDDQAAAGVAEEQREPGGAVVDEAADGLLARAFAGESFCLHLVYRQRPTNHSPESAKPRAKWQSGLR